MLQKLISYFWWIEWEDSIKGPHKTKLAAGMMVWYDAAGITVGWSAASFPTFFI